MTRRTRWLLVLLAALLIASISISISSVQRLRTYKDTPPSSEFVSGKCTPVSMVAHWRFDESNAKVTPDTSGKNNHGGLRIADAHFSSLRFSAPKLVEGKRGRALEFSAKHGVSGGNNDCFTSETFTVAAWVWLEDEADVPTIIAKSSWPYSGWWLCTTTRESQGRDRFLELGIIWGSGRAHVQSGYQLPLREWHHIVASLDNIRGEAQFFIDGKPFGNKHTNVPKWLVNWDHDLFIGDYDGSGRWSWKGKLDDVRVYNYVLSAQEVDTIYSE